MEEKQSELSEIFLKCVISNWSHGKTISHFLSFNRDVLLDFRETDEQPRIGYFADLCSYVSLICIDPHELNVRRDHGRIILPTKSLRDGI